MVVVVVVVVVVGMLGESHAAWLMAFSSAGTSEGLYTQSTATTRSGGSPSALSLAVGFDPAPGRRGGGEVQSNGAGRTFFFVLFAETFLQRRGRSEGWSVGVYSLTRGERRMLRRPVPALVVSHVSVSV